MFVSAPLELGKGNKLILSPFYEYRTIRPDGNFKDHTFNGVAIPLTWLHYFRDSVWSFTLTMLPRTNGHAAEINGTAMQYGGALVNTVRLKREFKLKFGLYYNREYFSDFFIPLAGIDWKINSRLNLYGILPGSMKLEYRFSKWFYSGLVFKSITNSYRYKEIDGYVKVSDNQAGLFADFYLPNNITIVSEAGYTLFKKISNRSSGEVLKTLKGDGALFKLGIAYRIRLDGR